MKFLSYSKNPALKADAERALATLGSSPEFKAVRKGLLEPTVAANDAASRLLDSTDDDMPRRQGSSLTIVEFLTLMDK